MAQIRMAQYGTGHGHAAGKLRAMMDSDDVEVAGVYEPDAAQREAAGQGAFAGVRWFESEDEMLGDDSIVAVASEGRNHESLEQTAAIVAAGKHAWYDKPAGDDWPRWQQVIADARARQVHVQMGYMLRYHPAFARVAEWARGGFMGDVFSIRAHMSTWISAEQRARIGERHEGGIAYDLVSHMLDQVVWMLGRPEKVTSFLRSDGGGDGGFKDNTLCVFEFERALAMIDIAALEPRPMARRFEVYGTRASAILLEPFEPGGRIRLCMDEARDGFEEGEQLVELEPMSRQQSYEAELVDFVAVIRGEAEPARGLDHELLVQESLLRAAGHLHFEGRS